MDLNVVCRTCLQTGETMQSIFSVIKVPNEELTYFPILELLKIFADISVSPNDGLPYNFCSNCLDKLYQSYTFKLTCEKSEAFLIQLKDDKSCVNEMKSSLNKFEHYVQEVKQETEIEINMEEGHFTETDPDEKENLEDQMRSYTRSADGNFKCKICSKYFRLRSSCKKHLIIHTKENPFQCKICTKNFESKTSFMEHAEKIHANGENITGKINCAICSKLCKSQSILNRHMIIHKRENRFQCEICSGKFQFRKFLEHHRNTVHPDLKPNRGKFKCPTCLKFFGRQSSLNNHCVKIHSTENQYQCDVCPIKFRLKLSLKRHVKNEHSVEGSNKARFKCSMCSKLFEFKCNLNRHMIMHTGEKRFRCKLCSSQFKHKHQLKPHIKAAHNNEYNTKFKYAI